MAESDRKIPREGQAVEKRLVQIVKKRYPGITLENAYLIVAKMRKANNDSLTGMKMSTLLVLMKKEVSESKKDIKEQVEQERIARNKRNATCPLCYRMFSGKDACNRHIRGLHSESGEAVRVSSQNKARDREGYDRKCPHCSRYFKFEFSRKYHVKTFHSKIESADSTEHKCTLCEKLFNHRISLKRHMKSHSEKLVKFACEKCGDKFTRKDNLLQHERRVHKLANLNVGLISEAFQEEFICKMCNHNFGKDRYKFESHLLLKTCQKKEGNLEVDDKGRLQCEQCDKTYGDLNSLTRHIAWKHRKTVDFKCLECVTSFKLKSSLARHVKQKHG